MSELAFFKTVLVLLSLGGEWLEQKDCGLGQPLIFLIVKGCGKIQV